MTINFKRIKQFLHRDIWLVGGEQQSLARRMGIGIARRIVITVDGFTTNNLTGNAAALTYSCILAAVPVLAIIFAIARGFNFGSVIEDQLRSNLSVTPDIADTVFEFIDSYLTHTHSGVFLGFGLIMLLYTVVMLTSNIETAFNTIWHVHSSRNIYRRIIDYITVFLMLPLIIVVTSGFSIFIITLSSQLSDNVIMTSTMEFVIQTTPMLLWCIAFIALYKLMPNTHVKWRSTIIPGIMVGALFQLLQYLYIHYQILLSSYNAIYGSFAALPMFMIWLNISWIICLVGAQLCYANQRSDEYAFTKDSQNLSRCDHDALCILLLARIAHRFAEGMPPYSTHRLSKETGIPHALVQGLLDELTSAKLLSETASDTLVQQHYLPRQDIHRITINKVINYLDNQGNGRIPSTWAQSNVEWNKIRLLRAAIMAKDGETSIADI